jgi:hypothetical protein
MNYSNLFFLLFLFIGFVLYISKLFLSFILGSMDDSLAANLLPKKKGSSSNKEIVMRKGSTRPAASDSPAQLQRAGGLGQILL